MPVHPHDTCSAPSVMKRAVFRFNTSCSSQLNRNACWCVVDNLAYILAGEVAAVERRYTTQEGSVEITRPSQCFVPNQSQDEAIPFLKKATHAVRCGT
jgi:hypothetical protein